MERSSPADPRVVDELLLDIAVASIEGGLDGRGPSDLDPTELAAELLEPRAAFVTVLVDGELNGCIGSLSFDEPIGPLVARLAWEAAFDDPRLPRLRAEQLARTTVKISLLSPPEPIPAASEQDVLDHLRPGVDGLIISAGMRRATFLPSVWDTLPDPEQFLRHLEAKAGFGAGRWPAGARASIYTSREITRDVG